MLIFLNWYDIWYVFALDLIFLLHNLHFNVVLSIFSDLESAKNNKLNLVRFNINFAEELQVPCKVAVNNIAQISHKNIDIDDSIVSENIMQTYIITKKYLSIFRYYIVKYQQP